MTTKPDIDNLAKFYLDCGNRVLWEDDSYITVLAASKRYTEKGESEATFIRIYEIEAL